MKEEMLKKIYNINKNLIINGDLAVGKTRNVIIPLVDEMINNDENLAILDPKEEYLKKYYNKLKDKDYNIIILNFRNLDKSEGWNPLEYPYKLIVVDEVSMLPKEMWELLLSHRIYVIALGDPGQLPPLADDNGVLQKPHVFLDEIMRQAQESEIIRVSMDIRAGKKLQKFSGKEVQIIDKSDLVSGMLKWADQIIVAKNTTRHYYNDLMRNYIYGEHPKSPLEGDKVICLQNDWDMITPAGDVLVNGLTGYLSNISSEENQNVPRRIREQIPMLMHADFIPDHYDEDSEAVLYGDGVFDQINMDYKIFTEWQPTVNTENFKKIPRNLKPHQFDYGYAITAWKAQGSEWDKVLVFEENFPRGEDHKKFLYTCVTRAKEKLVIVRK